MIPNMGAAMDSVPYRHIKIREGMRPVWGEQISSPAYEALKALDVVHI